MDSYWYQTRMYVYAHVEALACEPPANAGCIDCGGATSKNASVDVPRRILGDPIWELFKSFTCARTYAKGGLGTVACGRFETWVCRLGLPQIKRVFGQRQKWLQGWVCEGLVKAAGTIR